MLSVETRFLFYKQYQVVWIWVHCKHVLVCISHDEFSQDGYSLVFQMGSCLASIVLNKIIYSLSHSMLSSWINSIHLSKSVQYLMSSISYVCISQIKILLKPVQYRQNINHKALLWFIYGNLSNTHLMQPNSISNSQFGSRTHSNIRFNS